MPVKIRPSAYEYHDDCEKTFFVNWINQNLFDRQLLHSLLPLNPNDEDVFDKINDGILYCEIINEIFPNSIDLHVLKIGSDSDKKERIKNLQLAMETARSYGCQMDDIRVGDIFCGVRQSVLELFWQIFYIGLVVSINYENFPDIIALKDDNESNESIKIMKPEVILLRYVNQQIKLTNPYCKGLKSLKDNLSDGYIYAMLIDSLSKQNGIALKHSTNAIVKEKNDYLRNGMLLGNFYCLKIQGFVNEELLNSFCSETATFKMHLLTIATFFHKFGIYSPLPKSDIITQFESKYEIIERETNIEKLCRNFLNFIGVKPIVTNLKNDCKNGLILAQVMQKFSPDLFKKDSFIEKWNAEQLESKRIHNAAIIINRFDEFHNIDIRGFHSEYIQSGKTKVICGIAFNLMLFWAMNVNKNDDGSDKSPTKMFDENDLMLWVNSLSNDFQINSFRDQQINDKNILANIIEHSSPRSIDWTYLNKVTNRRDRVIYCVSIARREGYPMFIQPAMISSGDHRSIMLAFTILKEKRPDIRQCDF